MPHGQRQEASSVMEMPVLDVFFNCSGSLFRGTLRARNQI